MEVKSKSKKFGTSWTPDEDKKLKKAVNKQGKSHHADWKLVAKSVIGRTPGACQGRWNTVLDPLVDRSPWTSELDAKLLELYKDPNYDSWSKRAAKLAEGKRGPNGEPMRRSGADTCDRYMKLTKKSKKTTTKSTSEVKWTDETNDDDENDEVLPTISTPNVPKLTRNQSNRERRNIRRKKFLTEKAAKKEQDKDDEQDEEEPQKKKRKRSEDVDFDKKKQPRKGKGFKK